MVRGEVIRVTALDSRGRPEIPGQPATYVVAKAVARININEVTEAGSNEVQRNDDNERRLLLITPEQTIRYKIDIDFLRVDPGVVNLVSGLPTVSNAMGDLVGFDANTRVKATSFALEVWTRLSMRCADGSRQWGYTLFPFCKGGIMSGFSFDNSAVTFGLRGAATQRGNKWGVGPYAIDDSPVLVSGNTPWRQIVTTVPPPSPTNGIDTVIEGGNASMTSDNVIDGQFVVTSPDVVDGGEA